MTKEEFTKDWERLQKEFPLQFQSTTRKDLIAKHVISLKSGFWRALVDRMILSSNPRLDIEEAARGERLAQSNLRLASDEIGAWDNLSEKMSDAGLQKELEKLNATNLWDAIDKVRGMR